MKATYYFEESGKLTPREFSVLKKNADGTVDLGPEGGEAKVTGCKVKAAPEDGCAVLIEEAEKPKDEKKAK